MRLVYENGLLEFELRENIVNTITVENRTLFRKMLNDLWLQFEGGDGKWLLFEAEKELQISKTCEVLFNPYAMDINDKKMINAIYGDIKRVSEEEYYTKSQMINSEIIGWIDLLSKELSYPLTYNLDMDIISILKAYGVKIEKTSGIDGIIDYLRLRHQVLKTRIVVWINAKQYFEKNELIELFKSIFYEKMQMVIIEGEESERTCYEESIIIDNDLCII